MDESWQDPLDTWKSRLLVLHKHKYMTDCSFVINADGPNKFEIKAHKMILSSCSSEFLNLYFLSRAINYDEIIVRDVTPKALTSFVDYVYKETTNLTMNIIWDVLKLAKLYAVKSLERFCLRYLERQLNQENVLNILDNSSIYGLDLIKPKCMDILSGLTAVELYKKPAFYSINSETLKVLLSFEKLPGKEIEIYKAVNKWSEVKCEKSNVEKSSANKRLFLENCLDQIRFCSMTVDEFNTCVDDSILSKDEMFEGLRSITTNGAKTSKFSSQKRYNKANHYKTFDLFILSKGPIKFGPTFDYSQYSRIFFSVDKPILLCGFGFYGRSTPNKSNSLSYVTIKLESLVNQIWVELLERTIQIQYDGTPKKYEFFFEKEFLLNQSVVLYYVKILEDHEYEFWNGETSCEEIKMDDVTLTLEVTNSDPNKRINSIYWKNVN